MSPPGVTGIVETALYVQDLDRAQAFYSRVLGFPQIFEEPGRLKAFGVADRHVLLLFRTSASTHPTGTPGGRIPPHDGHGTIHLAFSITPAELPRWEQYLPSASVAIESKVVCPGGGTSLYFRDPDGHLLELITPGCWQVY